MHGDADRTPDLVNGAFFFCIAEVVLNLRDLASVKPPEGERDALRVSIIGRSEIL